MDKTPNLITAIKSQAIQTALKGDWTRAIALNKQILQEFPDDIDALNRIAFAFASMGDIKQAKHSYQKVLSLDVQNPIALKNLKRLTAVDTKKATADFSFVPMNNIFIEEPGKTKVVELINIADQKVISKLRCGEGIGLHVKRMKIFVLDNDKHFIGMLPDDLSKRLIKFINGGNTYEAFVKTINNHKVAVFIKETKRVARFKNQPSFATSDKTRFVLENTNGKRIEKMSEKREGDDEDSEDASYSEDEMGESF